MEDLIKQFSSRFADVRSHENDFKLFGTPFGMEINNVADDLQMELIDLKNDSLMKDTYYELMKSLRAKDLCLLEFYQMHMQSAGTYPNLTDHAKKMPCIFGSTYSCEQLFSKMKFTKNKMHTCLTDSHLEGSLRLASSSLKPNIVILSKEKQQHPSQ